MHRNYVWELDEIKLVKTFYLFFKFRKPIIIFESSVHELLMQKKITTIQGIRLPCETKQKIRTFTHLQELIIPKVSVREDCRSNECPAVDDVTQQGSDYLNPEGSLGVGVRANAHLACVTVPPVSEDEHHVEGGNHEHEVEEGVAVCNTVFLIVVNLGLTFLWVEICRNRGRYLYQILVSLQIFVK